STSPKDPMTTQSSTRSTTLLPPEDDSVISSSIDPEPPRSVIPTTTNSVTSENKRPGLPLLVIILIVIAIITVLVGCFVIFCCIRRKKMSKEKDKTVRNSIDKSKRKSRYYDHTHYKIDEWEIDRMFIGIDYSKKLGEGAFGSVYLGYILANNIPKIAGKSVVELAAIRDSNQTVAVKILHETSAKSAEIAFRDEIDLMKQIGYHERTVNLLGCVTHNEPILLISEHCSNGDLLAFMRERRAYMLLHIDNPDDERFITMKKQLMFALQVASGLEYLSSRGFVHRDIAARNIMVDHLESCKIGDFGLCRLIGEDAEYYRSQGGKLPLKWMSPEAIDHFEFSTASEVWSFGVLLFEICTLGGSPYAGWMAAELITRLKRGERMQC
ncbi:hypothetical protein PMAYCL1PPCAC_00599, partial [Pristionchus mayeri]